MSSLALYSIAPSCGAANFGGSQPSAGFAGTAKKADETSAAGNIARPTTQQTIMPVMPIDNPNTIDIISTSANGRLVLTISDHLDWTDTKAHQMVLQEKLNRYLSFIESGEIYEHRPEAKGSPIVIRVVAKFQPAPEALLFLEKTKSMIRHGGFDLEF